MAPSEVEAQPASEAASIENRARAALIQRHRAFGWWSIFVFVAMGLVLESMHGFKIGWYLDVDLEARRHLLRLAHAHGTLFGLVHLAFAEGVWHLGAPIESPLRRASLSLIVGSLCMPAGFILGGLFLQGGEPGLPIVLAPFGGILFVAALFLSARAFTAVDRPTGRT